MWSYGGFVTLNAQIIYLAWLTDHITWGKGLVYVCWCILALISKVTLKKSLNVKVTVNIALIYYLQYFVSNLGNINALTQITFKAMICLLQKRICLRCQNWILLLSKITSFLAPKTLRRITKIEDHALQMLSWHVEKNISIIFRMCKSFLKVTSVTSILCT